MRLRSEYVRVVAISGASVQQGLAAGCRRMALSIVRELNRLHALVRSQS
jgi:hypothetical protein